MVRVSSFGNVLLALNVLIIITKQEDMVLSKIQTDGYNYSIHKVQTIDGYTLQIVRLGKAVIENDASGIKGVVFMMHCFVCSCGAFIAAGPGQSLAYNLLEQGYDVWMGNARGTHFGQEHVNLTINDEQFWYFRCVWFRNFQACVSMINLLIL